MKTITTIQSCNRILDTDPQYWGELIDSTPLRDDPAALRQRMEEEGYLYLKAFFPRPLIEVARIDILNKLAEHGCFNPDYPLSEGVLLPGSQPTGFSPEIARQSTAIQRIVFGPEIETFYTRLLDGPIRHFDYIWVRTMGRGEGTKPHCDLVYMGRGTRRLCTAWIPYGDLNPAIGGLILLEHSHRKADRIRSYLESDVDTYCENLPEREARRFHGALSNNPVSLREKLGGRWLTTHYAMGDLLTFRMDLIHASLDNQSDFIRLSTDTRYQLASEPVDERWVGENPIAHGPHAKRGLIC